MRSSIATARSRFGAVAPVLAFALSALTALEGCTTNAATGRSQLNLLSREEEIAMGNQYQPELIAEMGGEVSKPALDAYIVEVGSSLAAQTEGENPSLPWEFTLLDSDVVNAFALPGGKVFVSRGLAARFTNEAQLASVLGHEVGHVTARHINDAMVTQLGASTVSQLVAVALGAVAGEGAAAQQLAGTGGALAQQGAQLVSLKFGREQEIEADALGIRYMTQAGYNPIGSMQAMQVLADLNTGGGGSDFFSTHPNPARRVDIIRERLEREHPQALQNPNSNVYDDRFRRRFLQQLTAASTPVE
ncbi:MAG: hypothetical protein CMJ31_11550, partial [Phycisphaerae bacterium]|nr:hypothetical protein [Phycisphaerae bacterium]